MIRGIHGLLYSSDPEATRRFFREAMRLPGSDIGEGWWIFDFAEGDLGIHPADAGGEHEISFYCDDIDGTVADLRKRGAECGPIQNRGWGRATEMIVPGGIRALLYEPRYSKKKPPKRRPPARKSATKRPARKK